MATTLGNNSHPQEEMKSNKNGKSVGKCKQQHKPIWLFLLISFKRYKTA
jgi:hypothetical protein